MQQALIIAHQYTIKGAKLKYQVTNIKTNTKVTITLYVRTFCVNRNIISRLDN